MACFGTVLWLGLGLFYGFFWGCYMARLGATMWVVLWAYYMLPLALRIKGVIV